MQKLDFSFQSKVLDLPSIQIPPVVIKYPNRRTRRRTRERQTEKTFVELGGGVGDMSFWCREGASIRFGFQ